ncbi:VanZ like family protein [Corynebacterium kalinowskii]|uniref:VanZ like family protein n=1 Tax=Corynebacterium kalinowskii TaxID=2675216 RepID=A0A6B8VJH7_9CORY|nr:VanZ family protein [Corynebacterium kalinowskii]QGU03199.1 VanZ like family protein [Corynebacterium kalinowskii]
MFNSTRSFVYYLPVIVLLTLLKGYFVIGHLWRKDAHHIRELQLVPFNDFVAATSWFGPLFNAVGNMVLFVPLGILAYHLLRDVRRTVLLGLAISFTIEMLQYVFALGISDTDDLILNTLGAFIGAMLARAVPWDRFWRWSCLLFATFIYVLYLLGPRLGSEEAMVDALGNAPIGALE